MKLFILLSLALILAPTSHAFTKHRAVTPEPTASSYPTVTLSPSPVPVSSPTVTVPSASGPMINIGTITGATESEKVMIAEGVRLANRMITTPCFKEWVLAASYTEDNGLSDAEILDLVTSRPTHIDVEMYTGDWHANHISKTVGYENDPFDGVVHMNRYFVNSAYMVGDNVIHEDRGHSLGFHHYGAHYTSEPYGMNLAYEGCSNQMQQARGAKAYKPPGIRLEIRKRHKAQPSSKTASGAIGLGG